MQILETKYLTKRFAGVEAVNNFSISIEKGKITSIIGPNGSGKTTLINTLSGTLQIDSGMIIIRGIAFKQVKAYEMSLYGITRTFQEVRLFEQMTILDNVLVVLTERNVFSALFESHSEYHVKKAQEALENVGLWEKRNRLALNLSYGQRKLLEIARALAMNAEIYLLDEPFAGLFPEMIKVVTSIMRQLREEKKAIILIEHNMEVIRELSDYIFVMDSGKLLAQGKPNEVLKKREIIEAYLGE